MAGFPVADTIPRRQESATEVLGTARSMSSRQSIVNTGEELHTMIEYHSHAIVQVAATGKLWNSECRLAMMIDSDQADRSVYRCTGPCGQHTADTELVKAGLLWHFRGRRVNETYGIPDDQLVDKMLSALHLAWVRNGKIYTAQFQ